MDKRSLWQNNFMNIKTITTNVKKRNSKLHLAIDLDTLAVLSNGMFIKVIKLLSIITNSPVVYSFIMSNEPSEDWEVWFLKNGLIFNDLYINSAKPTSTGKPYYDLLIDERAGFKDSNWLELCEVLPFALFYLHDEKGFNAILSNNSIALTPIEGNEYQDIANIVAPLYNPRNIVISTEDHI